MEKESVSIKRFILVYLILMGVFFTFIGFKPLQRIIDINGIYTNIVVYITSKVIRLVNIPSTAEGSIIKLPSISLDIKFGCNGLEAVMIYSVAVIAFPSTWKKRILGIIAGFLIIQIINIFRIVGLAYAGIHFKKFFYIIHIYIAQGIMIAISLSIFLIYIYNAGVQRKRAS